MAIATASSRGMCTPSVSNATAMSVARLMAPSQPASGGGGMAVWRRSGDWYGSACHAAAVVASGTCRNIAWYRIDVGHDGFLASGRQ